MFFREKLNTTPTNNVSCKRIMSRFESFRILGRESGEDSGTGYWEMKGILGGIRNGWERLLGEQGHPGRVFGDEILGAEKDLEKGFSEGILGGMDIIAGDSGWVLWQGRLILVEDSERASWEEGDHGRGFWEEILGEDSERDPASKPDGERSIPSEFR